MPNSRRSALALLLLLHAGGLYAQDSGGLERRSGHPYLLYTDANVARLRERVQTEPVVAEAWRRVLAAADAAVAGRSDAGERGREGRRGGRSGRDRRGGATDALLLAYRMTGDVKYAEQVKAMLLAQMQEQRPVGGGVSNGGSLMQRDPPWNAGLGSGDAPREFGIAYDTIYDMLTPDERKTLSRRLAENGILPVLNDWVLGGKRIHSLDTMGHNWWPTAVFGAGIGAMAILDDDPRARDWVRRVRGASDEWLHYAGSTLENKPASFDSDGAFYESVGYTDLGVRGYLPFVLAWNTAFAEQLPESTVTSQIGEWFVNTLYPSRDRPMSVDFGDSSLRSNGSRSVMLLWNAGYRKPRYLWYLKQFNPDVVDGLVSDSPSDLLFAPTATEIASIPDDPGLPTAKLYRGIGWTVLRDSWDKDATLLAIKSGVTWNHAHADAGTFILFHQGKNLISENGHSGYGTEEYDGYFRQSVAHNVMTFNGKAENPEDTYFGSKFPGTMSHLLDAGDLRYVLADATGPTSDHFIRNYRSFLWVGDAILVIDDVKSFEPGQFEFLLHPDADATVRRAGRDLRISHEDSSVVVRPLFPETFPDGGLPTDYPEKMRLVEKQGLRSDRSPAKYYAFAPADLSRRTKFITAILPVRQGIALPQIERLRGIEHIGVRVRQQGTVTDVYMNLEADGSIRHRNANLTLLNGWETDAYLFAFTYPDGADPNDPDAITRTMVIDGSYLRREGKVVLDSLSKVYLTMTRQADELDVNLQGQPVINAFLRAARMPSAMRLNRVPVKPTYDPSRQVLSVRLNQH
ncbi:Heparin-sulfate lyase precursor [Pirellulimonas nuda]|uniref:Heparin-sulfate lyase n=1 Tax=Pirellulimonas nuda TaxID=2528009 RepID=A0A518DBZ8_9BACT|nr:heparinase II/III family protein [Pirellulimonas nuda]QDU89001.1 Heparin-sulfate lyase precursor [Pirellulimonas nuda]